MKRILLFAGMIMMVSSLTFTVMGQERPAYITVTTAHWNMDMEDYSAEDWMKTEKEYFDKVTMKNDFIVTSEVLTHYFTADNSEILFVNTYRSWEDIEKANQRNGELAEEAWPEEAGRRDFFRKQSAYYSTKHSDEIYSTLPNAKVIQERNGEPLVYYVRISHMAFPEDGSQDEIGNMHKEYVTEVIQKNPFILGYYPSRHYWGSDGRDLVEAFVTTSLADVEKALEKNGELTREHWSDEGKRKEFFTKMSKYSTGWHGDYIYQSVPELSKH